MRKGTQAKAVTGTVLVGSVLLLARPGMGQPVNDTCPNALEVTCGTVAAGGTTTANSDIAPFCGTNDGTAGGVWYRFTGTGDEVTLSTCLPGTTYDTKVRVYTGTCGNLNCVVGDDDDFTCPLSGLASRVAWFSTLATEYFILVHGFGASSGNFEMSVTCSAPPAPAPNDDCANATVIGTGSFLGDTRANNDDGDGSCGLSDNSPSVWYQFTPAQSWLLRAQTCGSTYDSVISLHTGCPGTAANEVACDDDGCGAQSFFQTLVTAGLPLWIRVSGASGAAGPFTLTVQLIDPASIGGPDVIYSDCQGISSFGEIGGIRAYALGTHTCNIGDEDLQWGGDTPLFGMNAYRLHDGRLEQIGMSWMKNGTGAAAGEGCGLPCNGQGGSVLGAGCLDVYSSGFNGIQSILGPRSAVNAFTGDYPGPSGAAPTSLSKRLQIHTTDLTQAGALYFVEGVYVAPDDALNGNALNNASYKRVTIDGSFNLTPAGAIALTIPAIQAWADHGLGVGVPDPSVMVQAVDLAEEGRFHVAHKVTDLGGSLWRYDYAVFNLNSHRSAASFSVPVPAGVTVTNPGFHDVEYHSGEPYDNTDWTGAAGAGSWTWQSPETFAQNPNTNALRFGTMYNFWFEADTAPQSADATIGLFRPGTPGSVTVSVSAPSVDDAIPTVSQWGLVLLTISLVTVGTLLFGRRRAMSPAGVDVPGPRGRP